jgi:hypothetical protein
VEPRTGKKHGRDELQLLGLLFRTYRDGNERSSFFGGRNENDVQSRRGFAARRDRRPRDDQAKPGAGKHLLERLILALERTDGRVRQPSPSPFDECRSRLTRLDFFPTLVVQTQASGVLVQTDIQMRYDREILPDGDRFRIRVIVRRQEYGESFDAPNVVDNRLRSFDIHLDHQNLNGRAGPAALDESHGGKQGSEVRISMRHQ